MSTVTYIVTAANGSPFDDVYDMPMINGMNALKYDDGDHNAKQAEQIQTPITDKFEPTTSSPNTESTAAVTASPSTTATSSIPELESEPAPPIEWTDKDTCTYPLPRSRYIQQNEREKKLTLHHNRLPPINPIPRP